MHYDVVDGYLRAAECAGELLAAPTVADRWDQPSALKQWSVAGLSGHLARAVFTVQTSLAVPPEGELLGIDAVTYYARGPEEDLNPDSEIARRSANAGPKPPGVESQTCSADTGLAWTTCAHCLRGRQSHGRSGSSARS